MTHATSEMEVVTCKILMEVASWLDWWLVTVWSLVLVNSSKVANCRPFVAGAKIPIIVSKTTLVPWMNIKL